jgi:hypothetical protein
VIETHVRFLLSYQERFPYPELDTVGELKKRGYNQRKQGKRAFHKRKKMIVSMLLDRERRERIEDQ